MPHVMAKRRTSPRKKPQESPIKLRGRPRKVLAEKDSSTSKETPASTDAEGKDKKLSKKSVPANLRKRSLSAVDKTAVPQKRKRVGRQKESEVNNEDKPATRRKGGMLNPKRKTTRKTATESSNTLRQLSLKESFSNQARKLRSHNGRKLSTQLQCAVVVKRLSTEKKKVPVYKSIKPLEESEVDKSKIYDFKFDANDTKEKLKKKKKRINRKATTKTVKKSTSRKRNIIQAKGKSAETVQPASDNVKQLADDNWNIDSVVNPIETDENHSVNNLQVPVSVTNKEIEPVSLPNKSMTEGNENKPDSSDKADKAERDKNAEKTENIKNSDKAEKAGRADKPMIVSVENLTNKKVTLIGTPPSSRTEEFRPFRPTNVFNNKTTVQYKNMLNHSLLNKSLSPIMKSSKENFDPGSPWRPPLFTFSHVKDLFQSTPQANNVDVYHGKVMRNLTNLNNNEKIAKPNDIKRENNENILRQKNLEKATVPRKCVTTIRRFGTEITNNMDQSMQSNASNVIPERNDKSINESQVTPNFPSVDTVRSEITNVSTAFNDITEDKENAAPNYQTPKKSPKKKVRMQESAQKMSLVKMNENQENLEPQPGPSGLQKPKLFSENRVLRQSNLNNFLSIPEMPESTRISTAHGIFDDAHSTPITGKPVKKLQKPRSDVETAFGFADTESDFDISPIDAKDTDNKVTRVTVEKSNTKKPALIIKRPARLSVGEIRTALLQKNVEKKVTVDKDKPQGDENANERKEKNKNKDLIDVVSFSDTFDVLSETSEALNDVPDVPLFADLEPSHFTKPPKHSYKRKRAVRFSFSEDSEGEVEEETERVQSKKKRVRKIDKEEEKRLEEWVKSVNDTFEEIEQYDLVVE